jgi:diphthamide synthase (EF-2-diphthine--ammonia ligase)
MPEQLAGRQYNDALLNKLPETVDPCGEEGEFHTFAWDGPMFAQPIDIRVGEVVNRDGFVYADLLLEDG